MHVFIICCYSVDKGVCCHVLNSIAVVISVDKPVYPGYAEKQETENGKGN